MERSLLTLPNVSAIDHEDAYERDQAIIAFCEAMGVPVKRPARCKCSNSCDFGCYTLDALENALELSHHRALGSIKQARKDEVSKASGRTDKTKYDIENNLFMSEARRDARKLRLERGQKPEGKERALYRDAVSTVYKRGHSFGPRPIKWRRRSPTELDHAADNLRNHRRRPDAEARYLLSIAGTFLQDTHLFAPT